jgi:DNA mismatch repair protein MutS
VIERAKVVLAELEAEERGTPRGGLDDLPLFQAARFARDEAQEPSALDRLAAALQALHPDEMSPREALEALYSLKALHADRA